MKILTLFLSVFIFSACSNGTAGCNEEFIKDLVNEIVVDEIMKALWARELTQRGTVDNFNVYQIQTTDYNQKRDMYTCEAVFSFDFNGYEQPRPIQYTLSYIEDTGETLATVYGAEDVKYRMLALAR